MKILVEIPELIDDAVMTTAAIENLLKHYKDAEVTFVGSQNSIELFKNNKRIKAFFAKNSTNTIFSLVSLFLLARSFDDQDLVVSFQNSFFSKFFVYFISSQKKLNYFENDENDENNHQVEKYNKFVNNILQTNYKAGDLMLRFKPKWYKKPTFGIHPGSIYANKKRWSGKQFAKVAIALSVKYDIVLLGGKKELDICSVIEDELKANGISNYQNLANKTTIEELVEKIAGLDLFLGIDCGPMQIAAIYRVNSIILPTSYSKIKQRNQWKNPLETIIYKNKDSNSVSCDDVLKRFKL